MFARATIHPKLMVDDEYDGLVPKMSERAALIRDLPGKPLQFEHDDNHIVGSIVSAFPTANGEGIDVMFQTDRSTFKGLLSEELIKDGRLGDVSMTIKAYKGQDKDGIPFIAHKEITEVSLVQEGAIPGSHIQWAIPKIVSRESKPLSSEYIGKKSPSSKSIMSDQVQQPQQPQATMESTSASDSQQQIAEQMRLMAERMAKLESDNKSLTEANIKATSQVQSLSAAQQEERQKLVKDHVSKLFGRVMEKFTELNKFKPDVEKFQESMVQNASATGLTQILAKASSMVDFSFQAADKGYQAEKEAVAELVAQRKEFEKQQADNLKRNQELLATIRRLGGGSFLDQSDRMVDRSNDITPSVSHLLDDLSGKRKESPVHEGNVIMARASKYFTMGHALGNTDNTHVSSEYGGAETFTAGKYMRDDNAHIYERLNSMRGNSGSVEELFTH